MALMDFDQDGALLADHVFRIESVAGTATWTMLLEEERIVLGGTISWVALFRVISRCQWGRSAAGRAGNGFVIQFERERLRD